MPLSLKNKRTFWYFNNGMLLENLGWGDGGKGDSVGRNAFAYVCWPDASFLKDSILKCIKMGDDGYLQFYRYPGEMADTMSRDHVGAIILAFHINRDRDELRWVLDNLPWRISRKHSQTIDFWLWQKSIKWKSFWFAQLFFLINILFFLIVIPYNWIIRRIIGIKKIDPLTSDEKFIKFREKTWKWYLWKSIYPHFALFLLAWQIKILPGSWLKWILQRILLLESGNIVIDGILGKKINEENWKSYEPITSFIWSRRLENSDDILFRRMSNQESEFNDLNRGMLDYLFFQIDKIMLEFDDAIIEKVKKKQEIIKY